jgi:hypothetical protein
LLASAYSPVIDHPVSSITQARGRGSLFDTDRLHVLVVENGTAHSRRITEVRDLGTEVEVSDGVKAGDQVVLAPPIDLGDGGKVRVRGPTTAKAATPA